MPQPLDYAKLLQDPNFEENFLKGLAQGQALLQTAQDTPMQPPVEGIPPPDVSMRFSQTTLPESDKEIQKLIRQKYLESIGQQEESTKTAKEMLAKEMKRQEQLGALGKLDLRPFAQAVRQYGSTMAVVPAEAPESGQEMLAKLRAEVQKGQQALSTDQINFLKTMMEDKRAAQAGISQKNQEVRMFNYAQGKYLKPAEDYLKGSGQYNFVRNELATGQPSRINRALSQYARTMGQTGVLTDNDIRLQLPPTFVSALDRAYTYVTGNPDAELPPEIVSDLINTLDSGQAATQQAYQKKLDLVHQSFLQGPYAAMPGLDNLYKQSTKSIIGGAAKEEKKPGYMPPASDIEAEDKRRAAAKKK